jgi:hypothetical protein
VLAAKAGPGYGVDAGALIVPELVADDPTRAGAALMERCDILFLEPPALFPAD